MENTAHILPIALPLFFWIVYHLWKDRHLPEPPGNLVLAFLLGAGSFYLGISMYWALEFVDLRLDAYGMVETNLGGLFAYSLIVIGGIEELAKMIPFLLIILRFKAFDEPIDGMIYGSFIALGFASVENINHVGFVTIGEAWARGFAGPVVHMAFSSIWGYYIGSTFLCGKPITRVVITCLAFTAILHGLYDFIVIALPSPALPISASIILWIWLWRLRLIRKLHALPPGPCPPELEK